MTTDSYLSYPLVCCFKAQVNPVFRLTFFVPPFHVSCFPTFSAFSRDKCQRFFIGQVSVTFSITWQFRCNKSCSRFFKSETLEVRFHDQISARKFWSQTFQLTIQLSALVWAKAFASCKFPLVSCASRACCY